MTNRLKFVSLFALCAMALCACAKDEDESSQSIQERILNSYIKTNYPTATKLASGLTILEEKAGTGTTALTSNMVCYAHYNTYDLKGTCLSTTDSALARHLGTYDASVYYGPTFFIIGTGSTSVGLEETFKRMKKGGYIKAIIPPWLTTYSSSYSTGTSSSSQESSVCTIYEVTMGDIISDLDAFQRDSLESYSKKHFGGLDSAAYGFYFKNYTHPSGIAAADTVTAGTSVNVWYVGRLLDGYVFDTNIEDTAKKYGLYSSSTTYSALNLDIEASYSEMTSSNSTSSSSSSTSVVEGFARALKKMTIGDKAVTFFSSSYGYGSSGTMSSGKGVPEYSMLRFDILMASDSDDSYPPTSTKSSSAVKGKVYQIPYFLRKR